MNTHMTYTFRDISQEKMEKLAHNVAQCLQPGQWILLEGELGAGKTYFARALIQSITSPEMNVPSPTFTILQTYDSTKGPLWHMDLYRIHDPEELLEIGFPPEPQNIVLIEWPSRLKGQTPHHAILIEINCTSYDLRIVTVKIPTEFAHLYEPLAQISL